LKALLKRLARLLLGEYSVYVVLQRHAVQAPAPLPPQADGYRVSLVDRATIEASADAVIREQAGYAGDGALAYACWAEQRIVGLCFYWHGQRYLQRNFWPLQPGEAKLVQIITVADMRGRKVAPTLIVRSCADLMQQGFRTAYARVWHSNTPSLQAFAVAGWTRRALVIDIHPFGKVQPIRLKM
jgi:RimJ/RimL family protein N-acetyltransferase